MNSYLFFAFGYSGTWEFTPLAFVTRSFFSCSLHVVASSCVPPICSPLCATGPPILTAHCSPIIGLLMYLANANLNNSFLPFIFPVSFLLYLNPQQLTLTSLLELPPGDTIFLPVAQFTYRL